MIEFILWVIFILLLLRFSLRLITPWIMRTLMKRMQDRFYEQNPNAAEAREREKRREGETHIDYVPPQQFDKEKPHSGEKIEEAEFEEL